MKYEVTITRTKIANCETKSQKLLINSEKNKKQSQLSFIYFFSKTETGFHKMVITHAFNKNT